MDKYKTWELTLKSIVISGSLIAAFWAVYTYNDTKEKEFYTYYWNQKLELFLETSQAASEIATTESMDEFRKVRSVPVHDALRKNLIFQLKPKGISGDRTYDPVDLQIMLPLPFANRLFSGRAKDSIDVEIHAVLFKRLLNGFDIIPPQKRGS
jgi:hypothetical protein